MTITKIENITYNEAVEIAMETINIKGHECVFVNLGESFGYSVLVFKDGRHVYYANDYELHHKYIMREQGAEALRKWYIDALNNKLFTDAELMKEVKTYDEYNRKQYFLRNYWIMRHEYNTAFYIGNEQKREIEEAKKKLPFYNPVSFCYVADKEIITKQTEILEHLESAYERMKEDNETFREMIRRELSDHEACIACDFTDALNALRLTYDELPSEKRAIVKEELKKQMESYY